MNENVLIEHLTDICEWAKEQAHGFVWLTHLGHWKRPQVVLVFNTHAQVLEASKSGFEIELIQLIDSALAPLGIRVKHYRLDSEQACEQLSAGDWRKHLKRQPH